MNLMNTDRSGHHQTWIRRLRQVDHRDKHRGTRLLSHCPTTICLLPKLPRIKRCILYFSQAVRNDSEDLA